MELSDFAKRSVLEGGSPSVTSSAYRETCFRMARSCETRSRHLIAMDGAVRRADPAWAAYPTSTVVDFVVWGSRPIGYVDPDAAQWLEALLCSNPSKAARQILREVLRKAQAVDPVLRDAMLASSFKPIGDRLNA